MADELDDRLHDLAHDAEQLVVLAGPQAARARGERRRARRRAAAAGTAAALALGVTGWQLLPRLEHADGTRAAPPAASARPTPDATAGDGLTERLAARLLPAASLPFAPKWQWRTVEGAAAGKLPSSCGAVPAPTGTIAEAATHYEAPPLSATAYEQLLAYPDEHAAVVAADELRQRFGAKCGMAVTEVRGSVWGRLIAQRFMGSSKQISGVTVWIQHERQYVAVLVVDSPKSPLWWQPGDELDGPRPSGCLADSLDDLAMSAPSHLPSAKASTPYMTTSGGATGKNAPTSTDDC
jgi:hypothetical protein